MTTILHKGAYLSTAALTVVSGTAYPTPPANLYLALVTTLPTKADGTGLVEVSGGAYARLAVAQAGSWGTPTLQPDGWTVLRVNLNALTWVTPTANWGTVLGVIAYDAATGGNIWYIGSLAAGVIVTSGSAPTINAGQLALQES